jgi:alkylation response protein AidB-like acyl-CoA dehydrogenase
MSATAAGPVLPLIESDEHRALRAAVRGIAERHGHRYMIERARAGEPPDALTDDLADHGFLGVNIPEAYDGGGQGLVELAIVEEELSAAGCPLFGLLVSPAIVGTLLTRHGTEEQKDRFLRGIGSGREHCAFAITEAGAGSNTHRITTRARKATDGSYVLTGQKTYISGLEAADRVLVVATMGEPGAGGRAPLSAFLLDIDAAGMERQHIPTAVGMPDQQWTVYLDEVVVGADRRVGAESGGLGVLFDGLNPERILAAAICTGVGRYALDKATAYARERVVWGDTPIGAHQGVSHPLAEAKIAVEAARLMAQKAALLHDAGMDAGEASNMGKLLAADAGLLALDRAIQTHGGNGLADEYGLADLWFSTRLLKTAPVSREMILNHIAQHALGLPRSY